MGTTATMVPFYTDDIRISPHTASAPDLLRPMTLRELSKIVGGPISLYQLDNGDFYARGGQYPNITYIEGPEITEQTIKEGTS